MAAYILKRLGYGVVVLWGVITLVFAIFSINPGDPAAMLLGQRADEEAVAAVRKELGLDLPWMQQYLLYLNDVSPLSIHKSEEPESSFYLDPAKYDYTRIATVGGVTAVVKKPYLRRSFQSRKSVSEIIGEALPGTIILATCAIGFAIFFGVLIGLVAARFKGRFIDGFSLFAAVLGMSAPSFFSAIIISWIGGYLWSEHTNLPLLPAVFILMGIVFSLISARKRSVIRTVEFAIGGALVGLLLQGLNLATNSLFGWGFVPLADRFITLPGTGLNMTGSLYDVDVFHGEYLALQNLILPVITLGIRPLAVVIQLMRNALLTEMSKDYIRTARAKGLKTDAVLFRHALRNALNPVVTAVSGWFASMLAGAVFIEFIFNWKGLGLQVFRSLQNDDYPVVMGSVLVIATAFVIINILVDIIYGWLDPRIRLQG